MSLYSDDRRKRKWDSQDSSPSKSRSSGRDREERDRDRDRDRDRYDDRDRHESSSRYDERHGSSSSHRDRDSKRSGDRRSASPSGSRDARKMASSGRAGVTFNDAAAAAAAAAAAKIAANLNNRMAIPPTIPQNYGQVPLPPPPPSGPLAITAPPPPPAPAPPPPSGTPSAPAPPPPSIAVVVKKDERGPLGDVYQQDGDWMKDIEINNLRNRYLLTKSSTQQQIKRDTGADVTTRGKYYPDTALASERDPPLYLHITATTYPALEKASRMVQELIDRDLGSLVDERRFRRTDERDEFGRRKWPEVKIPIGMESVKGFNVRAQIVGPQGSYVKHISTETRTRVQIKGKNSGFSEPSTGRESDEPTYLHISGPDEVEVQKAKNLALDLIETVRQAFEAHISGAPPPAAAGAMHYQPQASAPSSMSPPGAAPPPGAQGVLSLAPGAAPGSDPYAAYGGYQAYQQHYANYYAQQSPPPGGSSGSPPGTAGNGYHQPANVVSPPPPPGAPSYGAKYSAMPPPPGA